MKKRILSIVLTLCIMLSIVPVTVFAANTDVTELKNLMAKGGTVKLTHDYTVDSTLYVTKDVTIDLNGYVIRKIDKGNLFHVELAPGTAASARLSLTLKDSNPTRKHTGDNASLPDGGVITTSVTAYRAVYLRFKCRFIMEGGTIYGFNAQLGGAVYAEYGCHFFLKNGTISNCSADFGGAVYLKNDVSHNGVDDYTNRMTMSGGAIRDCVATYAAGGVFCSGSNEFTMEGGVIEDCKSLSKTLSHIDINGIAQGVYIGAVYIVKSTFIVNGGIIKDVAFISALTKVENTNSGSVTKFYDNVVNLGTISGGVYYSGIQNRTASVLINDVWNTYTGSVTGTCHKVSFNLNGVDGSIPTQWFVNTNNEKVLKPTDPTKENYEFHGWYNGNTGYKFTKPVTGNITLTAKWVKNCVSTEAELRQAVNESAYKIILLGDIKLTEMLTLTDKVITLDLNGHVLAPTNGFKDNINLYVSKSPIYGNAILTLIDSNPTATHKDSSLPLGGVLACTIGMNAESGTICSNDLNADGGTVTGLVGLNHGTAYIHHTSGNTTPTAFMSNVSGFDGGGVFNGIYYGYLLEDLIKGKTVTFKNGDDVYAKEIVSNDYINGSSKPGTAVAPIDPVKDGYAFAGWYNGSTRYNFPQTVTSDITLTAKWVNEVNSEATLRAAVDAGVNPIKLMADINLSSALDLSQKNVTIDLNGYVLSGADISINTGNGKANLTLKDSRPNATHTDSTLPLGGVVKAKISMNQSGGKYNDCVLYANGGTVTSDFSTNTNAVSIRCTVESKHLYRNI